ncbi:MAG: hypothetical protein KDA96_26455, partial [Planctomycetaceae bacterium]|nr:hypothetical protein [Planctomycetaceae bacterium]
MKCLGIDVGSSSIKGAILDLASREVTGFVSHPFPEAIRGLPGGHFEIDPAEVIRAVRLVLDQLHQNAPTAAALYVSGQMGGTVLVNAQGDALTNYLSWRDQRTLGLRPEGNSWLDEIRQRWGSETLAQLGNELQPGSSSSLCFWLSEHGLLPEGCIPVSIADYVLGQLCHARPHMHVTHGIGMIDLTTVDWHRSAWNQLGLEALTFPELDHGTGCY